MLSVVGKFNRDFFHHVYELQELTRQVSCCMTVNTGTGNFGLGMIKSLFQLQVFLQSMASMHLYKLGIYTHAHAHANTLLQDDLLGVSLFQRLKGISF